MIFESDENDHHYGFYPSGGKLGLTRFEGPDVLSWSILNETESENRHWRMERHRVIEEESILTLNGKNYLRSRQRIKKWKSRLRNLETLKQYLKILN